MQKLMLQAVVFEIPSTFYIPLAKGFFDLVKCVRITDSEGAQKVVLFGQGSIQCFTRGQIVVLIVLCLWIVSYCISLHVGTKVLKEKKSASLIIAIIENSSTKLQESLNQITVHNTDNESEVSSIPRLSESSIGYENRFVTGEDEE